MTASAWQGLSKGTSIPCWCDEAADGMQANRRLAAGVSVCRSATCNHLRTWSSGCSRYSSSCQERPKRGAAAVSAYLSQRNGAVFCLCACTRANSAGCSCFSFSSARSRFWRRRSAPVIAGASATVWPCGCALPGRCARRGAGSCWLIVPAHRFHTVCS